MMGSRPLEIARTLGVTTKDAETIKATRRKVVLSRIAQVGMTILAALAGFAAGRAASPDSTTDLHDGYPYAHLLLSPVLLAGTSRKSWIAAVIVALVAFLSFFVIAWGTSSGTYGVSIEYGVHYQE